MIPLDTPLQFLKGVGPRRAADLQRVGLATVEDLLYRFPIRYEDRGDLSNDRVAEARGGRVGGRRSRELRHPADAAPALQDLRDAGARRHRARCARSSSISRSSKDVFHPHQRVILFGKLELTSHGLQMQNPQYEILRQEADGDGAAGPAEDDTLHTGRIVPIYEKTGTLTPKMQRALVHQALSQLPAERARIRCRARSAGGSS